MAIKIREKAIALFLASALLPLSIVALGSFWTARQALSEFVTADLDLATKETMTKLERSFAEALDDLATWSELQVLQDVLIDDEQGEIGADLGQLQRRYPYFAELLVTNANGIVIAATRAANLGLDLAGSDFTGRAQADEPYQGPVGHSPLIDGQALVFALPIHANYDQATILGALIGVVDWARIQVSLTAVTMAGARQDRDHLLILTTIDSQSVLYETEAARDRSAGELPFAHPDSGTGMAAQPGAYVTSSAASHGQGSFADPGWRLAAAVTSDVAFDTVNRLRADLFAMGALVALIALAVGWFGGSSLVRPLTLIIGAMRKLADGHHTTDIPEIDRGDEIGTMAAALKVFQATALDRARQYEELVRAKDAAEAAERSVKEMAHHDALTGLPNRVLFADRLGQALAHAHRNGDTVAVLCLDLDGFKGVNDTLGHPVGDLLLRRIGERLRAQTRDNDTLARMGGDEFAIVQVGVRGPQDISSLCERILREIERPVELDGHEALVGCSIGVALFPQDSEDPDQLFKKADVALYRAKTEGRGTFRFFEASMEVGLYQRKILERELRQAIASGEFVLHYQPQVDLVQNRVVAVEALLRWNHPSRGLLSPDEFVALAEDTGLIEPLGSWVIEQACADAANWLLCAGLPLSFAVNISPAQFRHPNLDQVIKSALHKAGVPAHRLKLEITERVLLRDSKSALATLHRIKKSGVRISLDDFGTGHASLSYLRWFPFDEIKIDRSFVGDLQHDPQAVAIVRAAVSLSQNLDMVSVGEGVETPEQLNFLRAEGCRLAQGYYLGRPVDLDTLKMTLRRAEKDGPLSAGPEVSIFSR